MSPKETREGWNKIGSKETYAYEDVRCIRKVDRKEKERKGKGRGKGKWEGREEKKKKGREKKEEKKKEWRGNFSVNVAKLMGYPYG